MKRTTTGVAGLDLVLNDGLEPGAVVVVAGAPGTGKTILAQQMCFANGTAERRCVYYTTVSEPHTKLVRHLEQFTFFDPQALGTRVEYIHLGDFLQPARRDGLEPLVSEIVRKTLEEEPAVVVVDSAKMLRDFAGERELRTALFDLTGRISQTGTALLLVGEYTPEELGNGIEFSLADGIIQLEYESREPVDRRWLRIVKMRGGSYRAGKHTFRIGSGGLEVFPRIETLIPDVVTAVAEQVPSGIPGLDKLMNGGAKQGDATLVTGPSGVGKTIFGMRWLTEATEREQRCLYVTFQDTADQLVDVAAAFGWDLMSADAAENIPISYVPMGDLDLDVLANAVRSELRAHATSRIVIDSLAELAFAAREQERFPAYMRSLVGLVRAAGSSLLITSETAVHGLAANAMDELLFLFDNVIDLRYIEEGSLIGRAVHVAKMRNSWHEMTLNSLTITDHGLVVGNALEGVTGRLGWSALRSRPAGTRPARRQELGRTLLSPDSPAAHIAGRWGRPAFRSAGGSRARRRRETFFRAAWDLRTRLGITRSFRRPARAMVWESGSRRRRFISLRALSACSLRTPWPRNTIRPDCTAVSACPTSLTRYRSSRRSRSRRSPAEQGPQASQNRRRDASRRS